MKNELIYVRDRRQPYHYTIDNEVYDMALGAHALLCYNALARHAAYEGEALEQAAVSQGQIARELGISVRSVQRGLDTLIKKSLLLVESGKRNGEPNLYVLLEVPKAERKPRYVRRGKPGGTSDSRTAQGKGTTDRRTPATVSRISASGRRTSTPGSRTPESRNHNNDNGLQAPGNAAKKEVLKGKLPAADAAKYSTTLGKFTNRVIDWHNQCAKGTHKSYSPYKVAKWLGPHIRHLGLDRVVEIFEHVAKGVNPYVNAFWQALREEREKLNKKLALVEQTMLADMPV